VGFFTGSNTKISLVNAKQLEEDALKNAQQIQITDVAQTMIKIEMTTARSGTFRNACAVLILAATVTLCMATPSIVYGSDTNANYYKRLGVSRSNTTPQIKKAFREFSRRNHPDKVPAAEKADAEAKFVKLQEAYDALQTNRKRFIYETHGLTGMKCFNDKSCMAKELALWVNDMALLCAFYVTAAVLCVFFTTLKGTPGYAQSTVYTGYLLTLAVEIMLRGSASADDSDDMAVFDLPAIGAFGELTRFEKAMVLRHWFTCCSMAIVLASSLLADNEADTTRSYFNALLLQQQKMTELLQMQEAKISKLQQEKSRK